MIHLQFKHLKKRLCILCIIFRGWGEEAVERMFLPVSTTTSAAQTITPNGKDLASMCKEAIVA
jgi:hypothetical protein